MDMIDHLARTHLQYTNSPKKIINKLLSNDTLYHSHHLVVASDSTVVSFQNFWQPPRIFIFDISFSFQHLVFEFSDGGQEQKPRHGAQWTAGRSLQPSAADEVLPELLSRFVVFFFVFWVDILCFAF